MSTLSHMDIMANGEPPGEPCRPLTTPTGTWITTHQAHVFCSHARQKGIPLNRCNGRFAVVTTFTLRKGFPKK